jgi:hypothetical protein
MATILICGCFFVKVLHHAEERAGIEFGFSGGFWPRNPEAELQILLVAISPKQKRAWRLASE